MGWQPIETAPRDGAPFSVLNHNYEVFVAKYTDDNRICFRMHSYFESKRHYSAKLSDGRSVMVLDEDYKSKQEGFMHRWTFWTRGMDFKPTHWMPLPPPPKHIANKA